MKRHSLCVAALMTITITGVPVFAQEIDPLAQSSSTVTNVTGTISQLNYGTDGTADGFLLGTNVLLLFSGDVIGGVGSLGAVGNSVTYSGQVVSTSSAFQAVRVTSLTNNTTKATYSSSTKTNAAPTAYGPTSGTVKQLNYDASGAVDSFVFAPVGSTTPVLVATGPVTNGALKAALTMGATISVTGTTLPASPAFCTVANGLAVVDAGSLSINGTTFVLTGGPGFGNIGTPGRGGRR